VFFIHSSSAVFSYYWPPGNAFDFARLNSQTGVVRQTYKCVSSSRWIIDVRRTQPALMQLLVLLLLLLRTNLDRRLTVGGFVLGSPGGASGVVIYSMRIRISSRTSSLCDVSVVTVAPTCCRVVFEWMDFQCRSATTFSTLRRSRRPCGVNRRGFSSELCWHRSRSLARRAGSDGQTDDRARFVKVTGC